MKSPLTLAFTHVAVATLAIVAAYFMLPGYPSHHQVTQQAFDDPEQAVSLIDDLHPENPDRMRQFTAKRLFMQNGDIETAIRITGLTEDAAEALRNSPPGRGQILHATPNATMISGGY